MEPAAYPTADPGMLPASLFEAVVTPHRSLSARGLWLLIGAICAASAATSTVFFLLGAWPVAGFSGAEVALAVVLLRLNARAARQSETILLTAREARVIRTGADGRAEEQRLPAAWLTVVLEERAARVPALYLVCRGASVEVARDIGETAKRALADELAAALYRLRHPVFDNPQLG